MSTTLSIDPQLDGKIAIVTGASRGIGAAIADMLAAAGATVIGTATSADGAKAITARLAAIHANGAGQGLVLDVTDKSSIDAFCHTVFDTHGTPYALVNNAAVNRDSLLLRMSEAQWDEVINANLTAVFRLCQQCVRPMIKARSGRIVNIASIIGATGNIGQANYAAAKAGIIGFTKSLALELAPRGITTNTILPGFIDTDMTRALPENIRETIRGKIPLGFFGEPDDVAAAVGYLVGNGGRYITGAALHVNGGMFMNG